MKKTYDIIALGELLIDFTQNGYSVQGNPMYEANPGGAPCNVLSMLTKLGHHTAFLGKVGDDMFGRQLKEAIEEIGIDSRGLLFDDTGDRDFSFYRNPGADMMLSEDEIDESFLKETRLFHFGTLSMTHEGVRNATKRAVELAKKHECLISFDPNLREPLWESLALAKQQVAFGLKVCDILKISDNEITWFTGEEDYDRAVKILQETYHIPLILLSLGSDGSRAYYKDKKVEVEAFRQKNTIETTGAGDTFMGSCLHYILTNGLENLSEEQLKEMLLFANAAASLITTKKGALRVMPSKEEVENFRKTC